MQEERRKVDILGALLSPAQHRHKEKGRKRKEREYASYKEKQGGPAPTRQLSYSCHARTRTGAQREALVAVSALLIRRASDFSSFASSAAMVF